MIVLSGVNTRAQNVDLDATMKKVQPAFGQLRKSIEAMDATMAKESTAVLKTALADVATFFEAKGKHDAHQWASDAGKIVASIETSAAASKWDDVKASAGSLGKSCQTCHDAYREKADDGTYRLKPGI
jgi:cytochrome c556